MHLATSPQAPAHQALPDPPQPACPCVARLCQVKSSATRNTVFRGKKKTALNKPFLLHLGKARPRGKTKHPRQQTGGRLEPGIRWTGKEPSPWGSSGHWEPLYLLNCLLHRILGKQHHRPGVKPGPQGQRDSIPKPFVSHVCHFT